MDDLPGTAVALAKKAEVTEMDLRLGSKVSTMSLSDLSGVQTKTSTSTLASLSDLPPDLWANLLGYARYEDCLGAFTVSKSFLNEVIPRVKEVAVFDKRALKVGPARRFTSVESVTIACLLADPADAPPLPERPAGIGYDVTTRDETFEMHGLYTPGEGSAWTFEVDNEVVAATVPFVSAFSSLERVELLRYVVGAQVSSDTDWEAVANGECLVTEFVRYYGDHGGGGIWSKSNDDKMRTLMLSFAGGYASGLLSSNVVVSRGLYRGNDIRGKCFSSHCVTWNAYDDPGEPRQCVCDFICSAFPIEIVAFGCVEGASCCAACLSLTACMEHVLRRKGGRELLQSTDYILNEIDRSCWDDQDKFVPAYVKLGLPRPVITELDIARRHPERPKLEARLKGQWEERRNDRARALARRYETYDTSDSDFDDANVEDSKEFGSEYEYVERFIDDGPNDESSGDEANDEDLADWSDTIGRDESDRDISEYEPYYLSSRRRLAMRVTIFLDAYDHAVLSK